MRQATLTTSAVQHPASIAPFGLMVSTALDITHQRNSLYQVSDAEQLIAQLRADDYQVESRSDHHDIAAVIHITAPEQGEPNPRQIFVGEVYPDGQVRCLDNTIDGRFVRWLYRRQQGCATGENCSICRWCRRQEREQRAAVCLNPAIEA